MVPIRQLQACSTRPLKVSKGVGPNTYLNNFPTDYKGSSTSNTENLVTYKGPAVYHFPHDLVKVPLTHLTPQNILPNDNIDAILDEQIIPDSLEGETRIRLYLDN